MTWGSCSSGGRAGRLVIGMSVVWIPQIILEQDTEPQIAPDEQLAPCMASSAISVCMCVWMGECGNYYKALWVVSRLEKRFKNARPFDITGQAAICDELRVRTWLLHCYRNVVDCTISTISTFYPYLWVILYNFPLKHEANPEKCKVKRQSWVSFHVSRLHKRQPVRTLMFHNREISVATHSSHHIYVSPTLWLKL